MIKTRTPDTSAPRPRDAWRQRPLIMLLATGFGSGMIRPYSGTWGSLPATFLAWGLLHAGYEWIYAISTVAVMKQFESALRISPGAFAVKL